MAFLTDQALLRVLQAAGEAVVSYPYGLEAYPQTARAPTVLRADKFKAYGTADPEYSGCVLVQQEEREGDHQGIQVVRVYRPSITKDAQKLAQFCDISFPYNDGSYPVLAWKFDVLRSAYAKGSLGNDSVWVLKTNPTTVEWSTPGTPDNYWQLLLVEEDPTPADNVGLFLTVTAKFERLPGPVFSEKSKDETYGFDVTVERQHVNGALSSPAWPSGFTAEWHWVDASGAYNTGFDPTNSSTWGAEATYKHLRTTEYREVDGVKVLKVTTTFDSLRTWEFEGSELMPYRFPERITDFVIEDLSSFDDPNARYSRRMMPERRGGNSGTVKARTVTRLVPEALRASEEATLAAATAVILPMSGSGFVSVTATIETDYGDGVTNTVTDQPVGREWMDLNNVLVDATYDGADAATQVYKEVRTSTGGKFLIVDGTWSASPPSGWTILRTIEVTVDEGIVLFWGSASTPSATEYATWINTEKLINFTSQPWRFGLTKLTEYYVTMK